MLKNLNWTKDLFAENYQIYSDKDFVGYLKTGSGSTYGQINGKSYFFNTVGTGTQTTLIYDAESYQQLGEIRLSDWMNTATIISNNKFQNWKSTALVNESTLSDAEGGSILYRSSVLRSNGSITTDSNDDLLILIGLATDSIAKNSRNAILFSTIFPLFILLIIWFII